jgi:acyl carrier protein
MTGRPAEAFVRATVLDALARHCGLDAAELRGDADLLEDLGLQSLDAAELIAQLEELFDAEIDLGDINELRTVDDVLGLAVRSI